MAVTLSKYVVNFIRDKTMHNVTLTFSDETTYTVTINLLDVKNVDELDAEIMHFAEQHIAGMEPHPLENIVGQERAV